MRLDEAGRKRKRRENSDVGGDSEGPQMESVQFGILENVGPCEKPKERKTGRRWSTSRALFMTRT